MLWDLTRVNTLITKPGRAAVFVLCANRGNVTSLSQSCSGRGWGGEEELLHQGLDNGASWPLLMDRCHFNFQRVVPGLSEEAGSLSQYVCFLLLPGCLAPAQRFRKDTFETKS